MIDFLQDMHSLNMQFEYYVGNIYESTNAEFDLMDYCFNEASSDDNIIVKMYTAVKEFFKKLITSIKNVITSLTAKAHEKIKSKDLKANLKHAKKVLTVAKKKGLTTYEMYDIEEYVKVYINFAKYARKACNTWAHKKDIGATTPSAAERFMKEYESECKKFQDKLDEIKDPSNKKQINIDKALETVTKYIDVTDNGLIYSEVGNIANDIEKINKLNDSIRVDLENYADTTGYRIHASTLKDVGHNSIMYIKRNADWICMYTISAAAAITSTVIAVSAFKDGVRKSNEFYNADLEEELEKDSKLSDKMSRFAQIGMNEKLKKSRAHKAATITSASTFAAGMAQREFANRADKRNSIYKDKD